MLTCIMYKESARTSNGECVGNWCFCERDMEHKVYGKIKGF